LSSLRVVVETGLWLTIDYFIDTKWTVDYGLDFRPTSQLSFSFSTELSTHSWNSKFGSTVHISRLLSIVDFNCTYMYCIQYEEFYKFAQIRPKFQSQSTIDIFGKIHKSAFARMSTEWTVNCDLNFLLNCRLPFKSSTNSRLSFWISTNYQLIGGTARNSRLWVNSQQSTPRVVSCHVIA
jgi:hypothetical protein